MLDKNDRLPYIYQSKIGYDTLIPNVILKEIKNLMGTTIVDIDIELKKKVIKNILIVEYFIFIIYKWR